MAIQTDVTQDARRRIGGAEEEYMPAEGARSLSDRGDRAGDYRQLLHLLEKSAQSLRHAAEHVENRGPKLLLKVMAQERVAMVNALRQTLGGQPDNPLDAEHQSAAGSLQEGLQDIQTSMTVQRQGRENVALSHLLDEEETLLEAYRKVIQGNTGSALGERLQTQRDHIARFHDRLRLVEAGIEPVVARVFDTRIEGESAVTRLRERGLDASQIDTAPITRLAPSVVRTTVAPASPMKTVAAGAFSGGLIGGLVGLALAAFVWTAPQLVGWVTVGPWALLIGAIAIGAFFGSVFGFFIGKNRREDDLAVTADGLINGEILVAAYPKANQLAMAEEVLQIHHARELNR